MASVIKKMAPGATSNRVFAHLTVGAAYAKGLLNYAVSRGANEAALMANANISAAELDDFDARIPFEKYVALMYAGKIACNDPALALHYGDAVNLAEISIVGLICNASDTMADAFVQMNRYGRLVIEVEGVADGDRFQLIERQNELWLVDLRQNPNSFPELTESTFARMIAGTREFGADSKPFVKSVCVTHKEPEYGAEYERVLRAPVRFQSTWNAMAIDRDWLTYKVGLSTRYAFGILSEHAESLLRRLENSKTVRGQVESLLIPMLHTGAIRMDRIAGELGVSRQTLYRKLKREGVNFETLLDELRRRMAIHYLEGKKVSINETAYLVGFSDSTAFSRAFKRWTGMSPRNTMKQRDF